MTLLESRLTNFKPLAKDWFLKAKFIENQYEFFQNFFQKDKLNNASWEAIQLMGENIHAFNSNALAKKRAFGQPNHEISYYKSAFYDLAFGEGTVSDRILRFTAEGKSIKGLKNSSWSEIIGNLFAEDYVLLNSRTQFALEHLRLPTDYLNQKSFVGRLNRANEIIAEVKKSYLDIVGKQTKLPVNLEIDQFFSWIYETYSKKQAVKNYWIIAPGEGAEFWDVWQKESVISIGWNDMGDVLDYQSKQELGVKFKEIYKNSGSSKNDILACYQFGHEMNIGDVVFVKNGTRQVIGMGTVEGEYVFDENHKYHQHLRKVKWQKAGKWDYNGSLVVKALTKITRWPEHVAELETLITGEKPQKVVEKNYWWLNASSKIWNPQDKPVGEIQTYTSYNENGNKRRVYRHFESVKPGDLVVGYLTNPVQQVVCLFEITKSLHQQNGVEQIEFKKIFDLPVPLDAEDLRKHPELGECEALTGVQGSLFRLKAEEFLVIQELWNDSESEEEEEVDYAPYTFEDLAYESFVPNEKLQEMITSLHRKKNLILQGPPGTGKTYLAKKLAYSILGYQDPKAVEMIQFHQSYSYEDFIQGYRPNKQGTFTLKNGVFYRFCREALKNKNKKYFFIIDEINRGNLSKIFGELLLLIEADKRKEEYAINLTYAEDAAEKFYIPENIYIIGMMNTADRSLSAVDYALRRRFSFFDLKPEFASNKFYEFLKQKGVANKHIDAIIKKMTELNMAIRDEKRHLGTGFMIGHSFFCDPKGEHEQWIKQVFETEIYVLLKEYWFDDESKVEQEILKIGA